MIDIKERLGDINIILDEIKNFPQTYNTILGEFKDNGTFQTIIRRKLNNEIKNGRVCKTSIPGTRFGKAIFYSHPKKYNILVLGERIGSVVFCFFDYKRSGRYYIYITEYWKLEDGSWVKYNERKKIFEGNVLKWL